jgi:hypothetical protein
MQSLRASMKNLLDHATCSLHFRMTAFPVKIEARMGERELWKASRKSRREDHDRDRRRSVP